MEGRPSPAPAATHGHDNMGGLAIPGDKPICMPSVKRRLFNKRTEARFPLEIWISENNMAGWNKKIVLSDFPGVYSYANGFIEGNILYLAFEFNRHDIYFARVDLEND